MSFACSYSPNYFSIEDILATQERIPCKFIVDVPKMGILNPSSEEEDLKAGSTLELPLWLVSKLTQGRRTQVVNAELPRIYREAYREILKADPCAVDLHKFNLHFYEFGLYAKNYDIRSEVQEILIITFKGRFLQLMDLANNVETNQQIYNKLDVLERNLYNSGHQARGKLNAWLMDSSTPLEAANMVINHKKRKRIVIEDL